MKLGVFAILFSILSQSYSDPCSELRLLYESNRYEEAFRLMQNQDSWPCDQTEIKILKAKVFMANYRWREANYELENLASPEAVTLKNKLNELQIINQKSSGAQLIYSDLNDPMRNNLKLNHGLVALADTQFLISEFPIELWSDTAFLPVSKEKTRLVEWIMAQNYLEVLPGTCEMDSSIWFTAHVRAPFKAGGDHYELIHLNLQNYKKEKSLSKIINGSAMYPCISGNKLIFSSNRDGGYGGLDLWSLEWDGESYSNLTNLGETINSSSDEIYPAYYQGALTFSSNREAQTFGGFDLFRVKKDGSVENLGQPINSNANDLNPIVRDDTLVSISSNRDGGLYEIHNLQYVDTSLIFNELLGRIELEDHSFEEGNLILTSKDSTVQRKILIDKDGYFKIDQLKGLTDYTIRLEGKNLENREGRLVLYSSEGNLVADVRLTKKGLFVLELLSPLDYYLSKEENQDESILAIDILGAYESDSKSPFAIALENSDGKIIGLTQTDSLGNFNFQAVNPDDKYTIRTEIEDPNGIIRIFNDKGETIQVIHPEDQNGYVHLRLNDTDRIITITNEENIAVKISELETFELPTIYFSSDQSSLTAESVKSLDTFLELIKKNPDVSIEISGHTDSQGESEYNMELSQRRIDSVLEYLTSEGIDSQRISGKGYGETMLINHCKDGIVCSEEEHAVNRRTELRIYQNPDYPEP